MTEYSPCTAAGLISKIRKTISTLTTVVPTELDLLPNFK